MDPLTERQVKRMKAVNLFRVLSSAQFTLGLLLVFFGSYSIQYHTRSVQTDVPYYSGAFIAGPMVLIQSVIGGAVFHKGHKAKTELRALTEPRKVCRSMIRLHVLYSLIFIYTFRKKMMFYVCYLPIPFASSVVGAILTSTYGFCVKETYCSYTTDENFNIGMAILLFILEILTLLSCFCSLVLVTKYASLFGVSWTKSGSDVTKVRPGVMEVSTIHNSADELVMTKWQEKVYKDVNMGKINEYRDESRGVDKSGNNVVSVNLGRTGKLVLQTRNELADKTER